MWASPEDVAEEAQNEDTKDKLRAGGRPLAVEEQHAGNERDHDTDAEEQQSEPRLWARLISEGAQSQTETAEDDHVLDNVVRNHSAHLMPDNRSGERDVIEAPK